MEEQENFLNNLQTLLNEKIKQDKDSKELVKSINVSFLKDDFLNVTVVFINNHTEAVPIKKERYINYTENEIAEAVLNDFVKLHIEVDNITYGKWMKHEDLFKFDNILKTFDLSYKAVNCNHCGSNDYEYRSTVSDSDFGKPVLSCFTICNKCGCYTPMGFICIGNKLADEYFIPKNLILEILARHTDILNGVTDHC